MLWRIVLHSLTRRLSRKALSVLAVWVGLSLVLGLLSLSLDVGDKINVELRSFGANIRVEPLSSSLPDEIGGHPVTSGSASYLEESELRKLKAPSFFWRNNIAGMVALLRGKALVKGQEVELLGAWMEQDLPASGSERFVTGARQVYRHWVVRGRWPENDRQTLLGEAMAAKLAISAGDEITVLTDGRQATLQVSGIVATGDTAESAVIAPLHTAQALLGLSGKISSAEVSALTTPENKLAEKYRVNPESLTPEEYERWYCTPYPGVVAKQIQEVIPHSAARVVRRVSETQGMVFSRTKGLIGLLAVLTLLVCSLSVTGILTASVLERRPEMALLQSIGARRADVLLLFVAEMAVIGISGGLLAAGTGPLLGRWLVSAVFGGSAEVHLAVMLVAPWLGLGLAWAGGLWPVWQAVHQDAAQVLHGR